MEEFYCLECNGRYGNESDLNKEWIECKSCMGSDTSICTELANLSAQELLTVMYLCKKCDKVGIVKGR